MNKRTEDAEGGRFVTSFISPLRGLGYSRNESINQSIKLIERGNNDGPRTWPREPDTTDDKQQQSTGAATAVASGGGSMRGGGREKERGSVKSALQRKVFDENTIPRPLSRRQPSS